MSNPRPPIASGVHKSCVRGFKVYTRGPIARGNARRNWTLMFSAGGHNVVERPLSALSLFTLRCTVNRGLVFFHCAIKSYIHIKKRYSKTERERIAFSWCAQLRKDQLRLIDPMYNARRSASWSFLLFTAVKILKIPKLPGVRPDDAIYGNATARIVRYAAA